MFGIGIWECFLIGVVGLIVFGPDKLPEIARTVGKLTGELKKGTDAMRKEFYNSVYTPAEDLKKKVGEEARNLLAKQQNSADSAEKPAASDTTAQTEKKND
jgi:Tat protein translocase TatB subunit